jgi:hypothetical protein
MIHGYFDPESHGSFPIVEVRVRVQEFGRWQGTVPFVIDTGSDATCIQPHDAIQYLKIATRGWEDLQAGGRVASIRGHTGGADHWRVDALFDFVHANRGPNRPQVVTQRSTLYIRTLEGSSSGTPSVLGWDLLRHFRVMLERGVSLVRLMVPEDDFPSTRGS